MQGDATEDTVSQALPESSGTASAHAPPPPIAIRLWDRMALAAAVLFGLLAPFTIQSQVPVWIALLLCVARPRHALRPLRDDPLLGGTLLFYFLVQGIAIVYSQNPLRSLICLRGDWPVLFLPLFLGILQQGQARRAGLIALLVAATLSGVLGLWQHLSSGDPLGYLQLESDSAGRVVAVGTLGNHLTYGGTMMLTAAAALALFLGGQIGRRWLWLLTIAGCGAGLVTSYARSAWIGAACGLVILLVVYLGSTSRSDGQQRRNPLPLLLPVGALLVAALLLLLSTPGLRSRLLSVGHLAELPRVGLWGTALAIFTDFPLFGAGLGEWKELFDSYKLDFAYMATGHPHSDLLNALVHSGLTGLLAFVLLWIAVLRACFRCPRRSDGMSPGGTPLSARLLGLAAAGSFLTAGLAQCYFTDEEPAGLLWFLMAIAILEARSAGAATPAPPARRSLARRMERAAKRSLLPLAARCMPPRRSLQPPELATARRILLVRQDQRLGNLVLMIPFLQALRQLAPQAEITLHCGDRFAGLFAHIPWIDRLTVERKRWLIRHPHAYPRHLRRLARGEWDIAFELSNPDTHSFYNVLLTIVSRAPRRVGFDHPRSRSALNLRIPPPAVETHFSLTPLLLLSGLGAKPEVPPLHLAPATPAAAGPLPRTIVIHPGGRGRKRWPTDCFAELVAELRRTVDAPLLVIGGPGEQALVRAVAANGSRAADTRTLSSVDELIAVLREARLYVGCDTGPAHLAAALGTATITLFLRSHPLRYAPLGVEHQSLLLGSDSRQLASQTSFPAPAAELRSGRGPRERGADAAPDRRQTWDEAFAERLAGMRPRLAVPPEDGRAAHVAYVRERIAERLRTLAAEG